MTTDFSPNARLAALAVLGEGILITDLDGRCRYANSAAETALGGGKDTLVGQSLCGRICDSCQAPDRQMRCPVLQQPAYANHDGSFRTADGRSVPVAFTSRRVAQDGRPAWVVVSFHDIRERQHERLELDRFKSTLDSTLDCVFMFDPQTLRYIYVNQGAMKQVGYSREELLSMTPVDIKPELDEASFRRLIAPLLEGRQPSTTIETVHRHKDGHHIPVEIFLQYIEEAAGSGRFVTIVRDLTEQRRSWRIGQLLHQLDCSILQGASLEQVLSLATERLVAEFQLELAWVGLREADGRISVHSPCGSSTDRLEGHGLRWDAPPASLGPAGRAIRLDRTQHGGSIAGGGSALGREFGASIALPLRSEGASMGALALYRRQRDAFDRHTVERLEGLAARLSIAIDTARSQQRLRLQDAALRSTANAVFITDDAGVIEWVNEAFTSLSGYSAAEATGATPRLLKSGRQGNGLYRNLWQTLRAGSTWRGDIVNRHKDGHLYTVEQTITPIPGSDGCISHYVAIHEDITDRKQAELRIRHMANHDELTDLPNRTLFRERLERALAQSHRNEQLVGLLFLDLDHFKDINDTMGHSIGDLLLQEVARRLREQVRESDTVARLGGDEFAIIQTELNQIDGAITLAEKLLATLSRPYQLNGHLVHTSASIGITVYPLDDGDLDRLLKHADLAMYRAKQSGRGTFHFYDIEMDRQAQRRASLEQDLRGALERGEFELHYQPQLGLADNEILGLEALLRWRHPVRGYVSPAEFIPIMESSRLILPIGEWVLREACRQAREWQLAGLKPVKIAVNLSALQFRQGGLVDLVQRTLEETGLSPACLELELTESILMHQSEASINTLKALNALGVELAIDDFGTGYSSLSYLHRFPVQTLKLDRSFVSDFPDARDNAVIARAVIQLAHNLNLKVVAEGVETEQQLAFLHEQGCQVAQGFHIGRPASAAKIAQRLPATPLAMHG